MENKKHLPLIGVGPLIVIPQLVFTAIGIFLSHMGYFYIGKIAGIVLPCRIAGIVICIFGIYMWSSAAFSARIDQNIEANHLVTTNIYAIVRNPIYSAFFLVCIGAILIAGNMILLVLPVIGWAYMTIVLKHTEEKWLTNLYGQEYIDYCKTVNRCIPWFAKTR